MRLLYSIPAAACLALVAAHPSPQDANPADSGIIPDDKLGPPQTKARIKKECSDPLVTNADLPHPDVWLGLGCHELHTALHGHWSERSPSTQLTYVEYMSNAIHGPPNFNCGDIENPACNDATVQCDDTFFACGHLLLNSHAAIHNMYKRVYDHIKSAHDRLQDIVPYSFRETFCPDIEDDSTDIANILIGIVTMGVLGVGGIAEKFVKSAMATNWGKQFPMAKDGMMLSAGIATPLGLTNIPDNLQGDSLDAKMADLLGKFYDVMMANEINHLEKLFEGSTESYLAINALISEGAFIRYKDDRNWDELEGDIVKLFMGAMVPNAWKLSPKIKSTDEDRYSAPFWITSELPCGQQPEHWDYLGEHATENFPQICYENQGWYLMMGHIGRRKGGDRPSDNRDKTWAVEKVPGADHLFSEKGYYGLTAEDMLISSVSGWKANNLRQGYKMPTDQPILVGDSPSNRALNYISGVREAGFIDMPVCGSFQGAIDNLSNEAGTGGLRGADPDNPYWPCA